MSEHEWLDIFADNLRCIMQERGISQKELSEKTGIAQSTISRYLARTQLPGVKAIVNFVYALDCDFEDLLDFGDMII